MSYPMTREQAQAAVATAIAERDAIQANLLDLDGSFGRRLLAGATLTGETRQEWEAASAQLAGIWEKFAAYSAVLDRAAAILGTAGRLHPARLAEAVELLSGPSVLLARAVSPLRKRELTAGGERRLTPAGTVAEMKGEFDGIAAVTTAAENIWNVISDGLRQASEILQEARLAEPELADPELTGALAQADGSLRQLRELLNSDPLVLWRHGQVQTGQLGLLREQAAAARARAAELAGLRDDADRRIAEVRATVVAASQARQDATAARERAAVRVIFKTMEPLPDLSRLSGRLGGLVELKTAGRWPRLASELDLVGQQAAVALAQCRAAERAATGLLGRRDELRGLLDAYRAKAASLGGVEDIGLDALYQRARDLLWTAPCDLAASTAAVTGYQQAVLGLRQGGGR